MIRRIYNDGVLYLTRVYLCKLPFFSLYLHIFWKPDVARHLHNHPWARCWTWPLWGGYVETLENGGHAIRWGGVPRFFSGSTYHSVERLLRTPTVTLFAHGRQVREWGFLLDGENVPWYDYLVEQGFNTPEEIEEIRGRYKE